MIANISLKSSIGEILSDRSVFGQDFKTALGGTSLRRALRAVPQSMLPALDREESR